MQRTHWGIHIHVQVEQIYMPSVVFKKNFYWMEKTFDMSCLANDGN